MDDFEDTEFVASEHDRLVSAVSKLDKTQHITEATRNESTSLNSEFNLIKRSTKLDLDKVVEVLGDTAGHVNITKKLKRTQDSSRVLPKPLEKPQVERIKRATGYAVTKKKIGRWDPVVARSRTADCISFPLKHTSSKLQSTNDFLSKLQLKSDLERELEEIDPPTKVEEEEDEDLKAYPMSYEEMVEHRRNLAKFRAQESYRAAKAKRQSKIKSKKYHRILKKERLKQQLKEFEELQKTNPEEALKKLETLEKARALERHTLRHKNTGKWAKNKLIRAKYDTEARQQIAEQLAVSRSLTQKTQNDDSTDDESAENEAIPDITLTQDPLNPWMLKQNDKSNVNSEFEFGYKKYLKDKTKYKEDSDSDSDTEEIDSKPENYGLSKIKESIDKISVDKFGNNENSTPGVGPFLENETERINIETMHDEEQKYVNYCKEDKPVEIMMMQQSEIPLKRRRVLKSRKEKVRKSNNKNIIATTVWTVECISENDNERTTKNIALAFDTLESNIHKQVEKKLNNLRRGIKSLEKLSNENKKSKVKKIDHKEPRNNLEYLKLRNQQLKAIIDEELLETTSKTIPDVTTENVENNKIGTIVEPSAQVPVDSNIDPNRFIEVKPKYLNTALPGNDNEVDELDDDDEQVVPKVNMEEVFEEDDVVASFRQEKEDEINKDRPEEINLTLPGWGSWGGIGVKAPKRKKNRFITKHAEKMPRRDENKGDIIIKEYKDPKLSIHKVKEVPYPFQSVKEYEASIRAPLGNTFIPEKAHKKLIKPSMTTKAGVIIEPMDEEELLIKKNRAFRNDAIIKIISKK